MPRPILQVLELWAAQNQLKKMLKRDPSSQTWSVKIQVGPLSQTLGNLTAWDGVY